MKSELSQELLYLFLPEGILNYFEIVSCETKSSGKKIYNKQLEEAYKEASNLAYLLSGILGKESEIVKKCVNSVANYFCLY